MRDELLHIFTADAPFDFDDLALRVFAYQFDRCEPYRRFCTARGITPGLENWRQVPHLPVTAFKHARIYSGQGEPAHLFETSGTTEGAERRGQHWFERLDLYAACARPVFKRFVLPDRPTIPMFMLAQPPAERPDSSLSWYLAQQAAAFGEPGLGGWFVGPEGLQLDRLRAALAGAEGPVALLGTAYSLVHLLESGFTAYLPPGSRVMETGGFKGRSREVSRDELYAQLRVALGSDLLCVNQYGMTEMSSNCYDQTIASGGSIQRKAGPDWVQIRMLDPETLVEVGTGRPGLIAITDLANLDSCAFLLTQDLGIMYADGFEVLGRAPGAEARGCSIAMDQFLQVNAR